MCIVLAGAAERSTRCADLLPSMRVLGFAFATLALSGCASHDVDAVRSYQNDRGNTGNPKLVVPLPKQTPFDGDSVDREAYLDYYQRGYLLALDGCGLSCCLQPCPHWSARIMGWFDGQHDGMSIWLKENFSEAIVEADSKPPDQPQQGTAPSRRR